jgi:hypothetical protein
MKTTIELPDDLVREAEAKGSLEGKSFKEMLTEGLRLLLARGETASHRQSGDGDSARKLGGAARLDITAWERLRAAYQDPFPALSATQMLEEFRGPVELPPTRL